MAFGKSFMDKTNKTGPGMDYDFFRGYIIKQHILSPLGYIIQYPCYKMFIKKMFVKFCDDNLSVTILSKSLAVAFDIAMPQ